MQGCFYVGVPGRGGTRWIERSVRAALLKECWEQLDNLEDLLRGPFFAGARPSLADLTVWPTIVVFDRGLAALGEATVDGRLGG